MNTCPITYKPCGEKKYSDEGLKLMSKNLYELNDIQLTQEEQLREAAIRKPKMSIQGVQPKLSARLNLRDKTFDIVDTGGDYILKPQNISYIQLPENEDLTMKLAKIISLDIPFHGLVYSVDRKLTYFIKRFDRYGRNKKFSVEDFAQLAGKSRETKYNFSMEKLTDIIDDYCTFPAIEKVKLFKITLFNFLTGNEDQHLKNFSLITRNYKVELSPFYDLINTTITIPNPIEELALPLMGKKKDLSWKILIDYWGKERLKVNEKVLGQITAELKNAYNLFTELIGRSFLSNDLKQKYLQLISVRYKILFD